MARPNDPTQPETMTDAKPKTGDPNAPDVVGAATPDTETASTNPTGALPSTGQTAGAGQVDDLERQLSDSRAQVQRALESARTQVNQSLDRLRQQAPRAKEWVEDNPALAALAAIGVGVLVGRLIGAAFSEPEPPPTLRRRIEMRARELAKQAEHFAGDAGDVISRAAKEAGDYASDFAGDASRSVKRGLDFAETVGDAVKVAVSAVVAKKAGQWLKQMND